MPPAGRVPLRRGRQSPVQCNTPGQCAGTACLPPHSYKASAQGHPNEKIAQQLKMLVDGPHIHLLYARLLICPGCISTCIGNERQYAAHRMTAITCSGPPASPFKPCCACFHPVAVTFCTLSAALTANSTRHHSRRWLASTTFIHPELHLDAHC